MFCWVTVLSNCPPNTYIYHSLYHISFLLSQVAINAETHNWLKYQEYIMMECLALNGTPIPPSLRLRKHWGSGARKCKNRIWRNAKWETKGYVWVMNSLQLWLSAQNMLEPDNISSWTGERTSWGPTPPNYLLTVNGCWGERMSFSSVVYPLICCFKKHPLPQTHFG